MIDLHCHILPGVDDGSADEEESCAMARLAVESGVTDIAATPHCNAPDPFYRRTTRMSDIFDFTADFAAEEIADFLLRQNPADILANRPVYTVREKF